MPKCMNMQCTCLESSTPSEHQIAQGNADIVVDYLRVAFRGIVETQDVHVSDDLHTRRIGGDDDDALLVVRACVVGVTLAHDKMHFRPRVPSSTDEPTLGVSTILQKPVQSCTVPFVAINDDLVTFLTNGSTDVRCI